VVVFINGTEAHKKAQPPEGQHQQSPLQVFTVKIVSREHRSKLISVRHTTAALQERPRTTGQHVQSHTSPDCC